MRSFSMSVFACAGMVSLLGADLARAGDGDYAEPIDAPVYVDPGDDGWDIQFRPYLWTADINGTAGIGGIESDVDVDFSDLLDALELTWSSTLDIRWVGSNWVFLLDIFYMKLEPDTPPIIDDLVVEQAIIDPIVGYRVREWNDGRSFLDVIGGMRWMYMNTEIRPLGGLRRKNSESWFDPHVGLRMRHYFNERLYTNLAADIGGFGIESDYVFQGIAGLGYHVRSNMAVEVFYRYFDIDYEDDGFVWDTETSGLFLGLAFYF